MTKRVLFVIITCFFYTSVFALMLKLSKEDLCKDSDAIVQGKVVKAESRWDDEYRKIYTFVTFVVDEKFKGNRIGNTITIRIPGGEVGDIGMVVSDVNSLQTGEEGFLFLKKITGRELFTFAGKNQGKFIITTDPESKQKFVIGSFYSYVEQQGTELGKLKTTDYTPVEKKTRLNDFKKEVRAILEALKEGDQ